MKYSLDKLLTQQGQGANHQYLFFWKAYTHEGKGSFSQWALIPLEVEGIVYKTTEH